MIAFAGGVLVILGLVLVFWDKRAGQRRRGFAHWTEAEGVVTSARIVEAGEAETPSGRRQVLWTAEVAYSYTASGSRREGRQTRFSGAAATSFEAAERIVASFPKGAAVEVAVDPDDPERSALAFDPPNRALVGLGLAVGAVGLILLMSR